eukprot:Hpha_TRINITY_DN15180_c2_g15::TRINITY_DN15180_c2_g15_i1::g.127909::m.127909
MALLLFLRKEGAEGLAPVELEIDSNGAALLHEAKAIFGEGVCGVVYQGKTIREQELLSDVGVCSQSTVDVRTGVSLQFALDACLWGPGRSETFHAEEYFSIVVAHSVFSD